MLRGLAWGYFGLASDVKGEDNLETVSHKGGRLVSVLSESDKMRVT